MFPGAEVLSQSTAAPGWAPGTQLRCGISRQAGMLTLVPAMPSALSAPCRGSLRPLQQRQGLLCGSQKRSILLSHSTALPLPWQCVLEARGISAQVFSYPQLQSVRWVQRPLLIHSAICQ